MNYLQFPALCNRWLAALSHTAMNLIIRAQGADSSSPPATLHHCNILAAGFSSLEVQNGRWEVRNAKCEWNQTNQPVWTASSVHVSPRPLTLSRGSGWYSAVIPGIVAPNCRPFKILFAARGAYHLTDVGECGLCTFRSHCCQIRRLFYVFFAPILQLQLLRVLMRLINVITWCWQ